MRKYLYRPTHAVPSHNNYNDYDNLYGAVTQPYRCKGASQTRSRVQGYFHIGMVVCIYVYFVSPF